MPERTARSFGEFPDPARQHITAPLRSCLFSFLYVLATCSPVLLALVKNLLSHTRRYTYLYVSYSYSFLTQHTEHFLAQSHTIAVWYRVGGPRARLAAAGTMVGPAGHRARSCIVATALMPESWREPGTLLPLIIISHATWHAWTRAWNRRRASSPAAACLAARVTARHSRTRRTWSQRSASPISLTPPIGTEGPQSDARRPRCPRVAPIWWLRCVGAARSVEASGARPPSAVRSTCRVHLLASTWNRHSSAMAPLSARAQRERYASGCGRAVVAFAGEMLSQHRQRPSRARPSPTSLAAAGLG